MDNFDEESLNAFIKNSKKLVTNKLDSYRILNNDELKSHSDLLCMVLEYSPKVTYANNTNKKISIRKKEEVVSRDLSLARNLSRTLNLERHDADEEEKDNMILTRNSSKTSSGRKVGSPSKVSANLQKNSKMRTSGFKNSSSDIQIKEISDENEDSPLKEVLVSVVNKDGRNNKEYKEDKENNQENEEEVNTKKFELNPENGKNNDNNANKADDNKDKKDEEEDSEDEDDLINRRNKQLALKQFSNNSITKHSITGSTNKIKVFDIKIRIYLFKSNDFLDISIFVDDSVLDLKNKILQSLDTNNTLKSKFKLKYFVAEAYDIRMIEDEDDHTPNMDFAPLDDKLTLVKSGHRVLTIIEKKNYDPSQDMRNKYLLGSHMKKDENRITIKIYFKFEGAGESTVIEEPEDKPLSIVLEKIYNKKNLNFKHLDFYYFTEHKENQPEEANDDIDNEINIDTQMKFLTVYELDLHLKKFPDAPEAKTISLVPSYTLNGLTGVSQVEPSIKLNSEDKGKDFLYNEKSAGLYQEFDVIKINKYKVKQERILGIDLYNVYNNVPEINKKPGVNFFFSNNNEAKKPVMKIKDIVKAGYINKLSFFIEIRNPENNKTKQNIYEVKDMNKRNEIVSKLNYLVKMNESGKKRSDD